jgi:ABC-2 type transport system ATP-binding protein
MELAVHAIGLRKRFGTREVLAGLDLAVPAGTLCGLVGPNGAGKTTAVRILSTLLRPDAGSAMVAGYDVVRQPQHVRHRMGLAGQYAAVDELLSGRANLIVFGRMYHLSGHAARRRADELLERFDLAEAAGRPVRTYSGGMRRRLDLAGSLIVAPPVLFLDEPTTGIDPRTRLQIWKMIGDLVASGTAVLLTTQYLDEADRLAGQIVVLSNGRVAAAGTPAQLKSLVARSRIDVVLRDWRQLPIAAAAMQAATGNNPEVEAGEGRASVPVTGGPAMLIRVAGALAKAGVEVEDIGLRQPTLDEVFLCLTSPSADLPATEAAR